MDGFTDAELESARKVLRAMLGHPDPDPEPEKTGNHVPAEGRNPTPPGISPEQYARDFIRRVTGEVAAYAEQLPEPEPK
jgi:hypothetical protein